MSSGQTQRRSPAGDWTRRSPPNRRGRSCSKLVRRSARYDKLADRYEAMLHVVLLAEWL
jgi:hypothetical protein